MKLGISGLLTKISQNHPITPLIAVFIALMGIMAAIVTPKEEDPQIDVTMVDIFLQVPGQSAKEIESQIVSVAEHSLTQISGVEHLYSTTQQGSTVITVQFDVGIKRQEALVKTWNQVMADLHWPETQGVLPPMVHARGINDVPIVTITFWSDNPQYTQNDLGKVANSVGLVLKRIEGTKDIEVSGYTPDAINVELDLQKLQMLGIDFNTLQQSIAHFGQRTNPIPTVTDNKVIQVQVGQFLTSKEDVEHIVIAANGDSLVHLGDVAKITLGPSKADSYVQLGFGSAAEKEMAPTHAVSLSIAKQEGQNAIDVVDRVFNTRAELEGRLIPDDVHYEITRNSGKTANDKANKLIEKLFFATLSVVVLVLFALGKRPAIVVGLAVFLTLLGALFASYAWGFTLNRISLFALIFSIGILVDDAIVVVENIHRRRLMEPNSPLKDIIPKAVDEVGGSTILATFTVIAALVPMAFVSGLMGPYMSPIPINASSGMFISLIIAFTFTPWLAMRVFKNDKMVHENEGEDLFGKYFGNALAWVVASAKRQWYFFIALILMLVAVMLLPFNGNVLLKMLPFDNKPTLAISVDMPEGTAVEHTLTALQAMAKEISNYPEVINYELYAGTNAPITFNGLVRQSYLRKAPHLGEIAITLTAKGDRDIRSHQISKALRTLILPIAKTYHAKIQMVEEPSGPPTMAPIVAQIYGPTTQERNALAKRVEAELNAIPDMVDTDTTLVDKSSLKKVVINTDRAAQLGVTKQAIENVLAGYLAQKPITYLHDQQQISPLPLFIYTSDAFKVSPEQWKMVTVTSQQGLPVPLADLVDIITVENDAPIYHKDLRPLQYVVGDLAGHTDSPLYGMFSAAEKLDDIEQYYTAAPDIPYTQGIKWDGEWQITYETFRDMGIAYSVGLILIYGLIVMKFHSYRVPLIIMAPIPLTIIGIFPGHALFDAKFTAPSMIGMIALAGIIVRNSILLVDVIEQQIKQEVELSLAVVNSARLRARPIVLTAVAAMIGGFFIIDDPIFKGLAISLIFGLFVSSILTLIAIPIGYYRMVNTNHT